MFLSRPWPFVLLLAGTLVAQQKTVPHLTREDGIFASTLVLTNQSLEPVSFRLSPFDVNGAPLPFAEQIRSGELPGHAALIYTQGDRLPAGTSHLIVEMSGDLDVVVQMKAKNNPGSPTRISAAAAAAKTWRIEPGNWDEVVDALAVVNTAAVATDIQIRQLRQDGAIIKTLSPVSLSNTPSLAKRLFVLNGAFTAEPNAWFEVIASEPIAVTALSIDFRNTYAAIENREPRAVDQPEFNFGLANLSDEDRAEYDAFRNAWLQFQDMDEETFIRDYATAKNHRSSLGYNPLEATNLDLILKHFAMDESQLAAFAKNGFVIAGNMQSANFFSMYKDLYIEHLPVYISVDAVLDALHLSFDRMLMDLEENILSEKLARLLEKMEQGLEDARRYASSHDIETELDDLSFWLCVARSLLAGQQTDCARDVSGKVARYLDHIAAQTPNLQIQPFGNVYNFDFSQFKPRGHYTRTEKLRRYFKTMMWVQRMGMDFTDNPRDAAAAYLFSRILVDSGAVEDWRTIDETLKAIVGDSDSLNPLGMIDLTDALEITSIDAFHQTESYDAFRRAALERGAGLQRINSMILMDNPAEPDGFTPLPPAFFALGQRFIVDSYVFTNLVYPRVNRPDKPTRFLPRPEEAMFALGNRTTTQILAEEVRTHGHQANLAAMDWLISNYDASFWQENLYNRWLASLRVLNADTTGPAYPTVMATDAWDRRILQSQMGSWSHLRHDTLLYAKASFTGVTCEYPDGWVDPYPEFFETLGGFARSALKNLDGLGVFDFIGAPSEANPDQIPFTGRRLVDYFLSFEENMEKLAELARNQLAGEPLTSDQLEYVNNLVQRGICGGPDFSGWYANMIYGYNEENAEAPDPTIADIHTDPNSGSILHVGTATPSLMLISIANDCGVRAYVGPVLSYHQLLHSERLTDQAWSRRLSEPGNERRSRPDWTRDIIIEP